MIAESPAKGNLCARSAALRELQPDQQRMFDSYFIGALSVLCSSEDWQKALSTAEACFKMSGDR